MFRVGVGGCGAGAGFHIFYRNAETLCDLATRNAEREHRLHRVVRFGACSLRRGLGALTQRSNVPFEFGVDVLNRRACDEEVHSESFQLVLAGTELCGLCTRTAARFGLDR